MRFPKIGVSMLATLLVGVSVSSSSSLQTNQLEADSLLNPCREQLQANQFEVALQTCQKALDTYRATQNRLEEAKALNNLGVAYRSLQNYSKAIEYLQQGLIIVREISHNDLESKILKNLDIIGDILSEEGLKDFQSNRFEASIQTLLQVVTIYKTTGNRTKEAGNLIILGSAFVGKGDYGKAIELLEQSLIICRELGIQQLEGYTLLGLGTAYASMGNQQRSIELYQQGLFLARQIKDSNLEKTILEILDIARKVEINRSRKAEADRLLELGEQQFKISQFQSALQSWQQALSIYKEIEDPSGEAQSLNGLGIVYGALAQYQQAIEYFQMSLAISLKFNLHQNKGNSFNNLGNVYNSLGKYKEAISFFHQALAIAQEFGDREAQSRSLNNIGIVYKNQGRYQVALESYQQALVIAREIGNSALQVSSLNNLSEVYRSQGKYQLAIKYQQQSLEIAQQIKDRRAEAYSLTGLGIVYNFQGRYQQAVESFQRSLQILREIGDRKGEANALQGINSAYISLGNYQLAIESSKKSLTIAQEINSPRLEALSLAELGNVYMQAAQYEQAIKLFQQSLAIAQKIGDLQGKSHSLNLLGTAYSSLGQYQDAIEPYQQCLTIARQLGERQKQADCLLNFGELYRKMGQHQQAVQFYQQSLEMYVEIGSPGGVASSLNNLALIYQYLGQHQRAIELYEQQLEIARSMNHRFLEAAALENLGTVYTALEQYQKAIKLYQQSLAIKREIRDRNGEGISLSNLGFTLLKKGSLNEAETTLRAAIEVWESIRNLINTDFNKVSIFELQSDTYKNLQEVLTLQNKTNEALEVAERSRARAFVDLLIRRLSPQLEDQPRIIYPSYVKIKQIAQKQNATIVQYSMIYAKKLYIWVVKPTGEVVFRQLDLKQLQQHNRNITTLVPRIRKAIGVRSGTNTNEAAFKPGDRIHFKGDKPNSEPWEVVSFDAQSGILRVRLPSFTEGLTIPKSVNDVEDFGQTSLQQLHQILIEPIADLLPKNASDRVIFIPQGELFLVPFPALQDKDGKYLIEKHTILTAPSIQVLDLTRKQRQRLANSTAKEVLVVGNPSPMPAPFQSLEYAEPEAKAIANLLNTKAITGTQATESAIVAQMSNAKMIHLATHGQFDDIRGLGSAIALAPSGKDDGLLTAEEILNLKLNAELVVLSACDTGRGRLTGDGVIGLSRSLISAGVSSVIVSLWKVPDNTTSGLMVEFYRQLKGNPDKAQALRQAMLTTMKEHPNPRDWAAFTLIGEAQ